MAEAHFVEHRKEHRELGRAGHLLPRIHDREAEHLLDRADDHRMRDDGVHLLERGAAPEHRREYRQQQARDERAHRSGEKSAGSTPCVYGAYAIRDCICWTISSVTVTPNDFIDAELLVEHRAAVRLRWTGRSRWRPAMISPDTAIAPSQRRLGGHGRIGIARREHDADQPREQPGTRRLL